MKNLATKLVKVLGAITGKVNKSGYNTHNKYHYVMESDLLDAVRGELIKNGIFVFSSVEEVSHVDGLTTVKTKHTFVDSENGETFEVWSSGQGADKQDKGVYKAITGASKYFWMKTFMMAGDDDPETDTTKAAAPTPAPTPTPKSSPKPSSFQKPKGPAFKTFPAKSGFGSTVAEKVEEVVETPVEDLPF